MSIFSDNSVAPILLEADQLFHESQFANLAIDSYEYRGGSKVYYFTETGDVVIVDVSEKTVSFQTAQEVEDGRVE